MVYNDKKMFESFLNIIRVHLVIMGVQKQ